MFRFDAFGSLLTPLWTMNKEKDPKEGECGLLETEAVVGEKPKKIWIVRIPTEVTEMFRLRP